MIANKGEETLSKYIEQYFEGDNSLIVRNYPVYLGNEGFRKEIDFMIFNKELGLVVIEVKGLKIENIKKIVGYTWFCEDFYSEKIEPFRQLESQVDAVGALFTNICGQNFKKSICVALPFITRVEWVEKFRDTPNLPKTIIFKDDLILGSWIGIVENSRINNVKENLSDSSWSKLKNALSLSTYIKPKASKIRVYSVLSIGSASSFTSGHCKELADYARNGAKIFVLTDEYAAVKCLDKNLLTDKYFGNIEIHISKSKIMDRLEILNGNLKDEDSFCKLVSQFENFNREQYLATHAPINKNVFVTASAGTGKTFLMVERLIYLMTVWDIELTDITFVTFTNASTNELKRKIQEKALDMFVKTQSTLYLDLLERVNDLEISTIHSFLRRILKLNSSTLGLSKNFKISGKKHLKELFVESLIDQFFKESPNNAIDELPYEHYKITKLILSTYDAIEKYGVPYSKVDSLNIDQNKEFPILTDLIQYIIPKLDKMLRDEKLKDSEIELSDLIRMIELTNVSKDNINSVSRPQFLFVDEFQDTDRAQIKFFADILNTMDFRAFFVGDIKQSIYRFRGADYTGFDLIKTWTSIDLVEYELRSNYRSIKPLLNHMNKWFSNLAREGLINYDDKDWVRGVKEGTSENCIIEKINNSKGTSEELILEVVKDAINERKKTSNGMFEKIAVLTRSNNKAKQVRAILDTNGIKTITSLTGLFFKSKAVLDFRTLLEGFLYLDDPVSRYNLLVSPYFKEIIHLKELLVFEGNRTKLLNHFNDLYGLKFWSYVERLKYEPFLSVLQRLIFSEGFVENIYKGFIDENQELEGAILSTREYIADYNHLHKLIQTTFSTETTNLIAILDWLQINIATNDQEDGPQSDNDGEAVIISTVHKAKGLEYGQVIIPFTDESFDYKNPNWIDIIISEKENYEYQVDWYDGVNNKSLNYNSSSHYEAIERRKEEARILYVLLTRAERKLVYILPKKIKKNTWAEFIQIAKGETI